LYQNKSTSSIKLIKYVANKIKIILLLQNFEWLNKILYIKLHLNCIIWSKIKSKKNLSIIIKGYWSNWLAKNYQLQLWSWWLPFLSNNIFVKYSKKSEEIHKNSIAHLQQCLMFSTPKTLECYTCEFRNEFLHDLHHGQITNEQNYI
jgi:hypothetical protein